jgi:hypothetical protein
MKLRNKHLIIKESVSLGLAFRLELNLVHIVVVVVASISK